MNKNIFSEIFRKMGLKFIKSENSGFEYLLKDKRYENQVLKLFGHPFNVSDGKTFYYSHREVFIDEIYKFESDVKNPRIIDCGSNYGTSIIYFKQLYPGAKIVGVEADPSLFSILNKNINQFNFKNVSLLNKAVSTEGGPIRFFKEGADGGRIHRNSEAKATCQVDTVSLDDLIGDEPVDFLKMDIEGAETGVICSAQKLGRVGQLFIEYHSFIDERQKLGDLLSCLSKHNFRYYIHTQFCSKNPLIKNESQLGMDLQLNIFAKRN